MASKRLTITVPAATDRNAARRTFPWLRIAIHGIGWYSLAALLVRWQTSGLTANPIQYVEQFLGRAALNLLVVTLAVTPVITLTGWSRLSPHRRTLGLYTFFYFILHLLTFLVVDYGLDWSEIYLQTFEKPFILVGLLAGSILLALAVTSFNYFMRRMGKKWRRLHQGVYLAGGLVILHYAWAVKGTLSTLSGDIVRPLVMGLLVAVLLILRIPPVRRWAASLRRRLR